MIRSIFAATALAPSLLFAQPVIPIRELLPPDATAADRFGNIFNVRQIANGRVLVNDGARHQLSLLDAKLANRAIVLDSLSEGGQFYGTYRTPLIPYLGDSTFFPDMASKTLLLIDGAGKVVRAVAAPKARDLPIYLFRSQSGVDVRGNLIYRAQYARENQIGEYLDVIPQFSDSEPLVRANFETRTVDTIASVKIEPFNGYTASKDSAGNIMTDAAGRRIPTITSKPLNTIDEWSALSDGSIAIVRGHDYHVDIIQPDGKKISAPKLPFDFRRLTDEDKQQLLDSAKAAESKRRREVAAEPIRPRNIGGGRGAATGGGGGGLPPVVPFYEYQPASQMPDYYPPIRVGATKPDADGHLWILPTTSARSLKGELVYDVVNNRGAMIERVRMPVGRSVAGFGRGGIVYLMSQGSDKQWILERTHIANRN